MKDRYCLVQHQFVDANTYNTCRGCGAVISACQTLALMRQTGINDIIDTATELEFYRDIGTKDLRTQKLTRILR